jgi:glycosyltransferase involved in cell wall biosynthesis
MKNRPSLPKRKKAALFDPYLDILGGGEKHILSILKVVEEQGFDISIFWDKDLSRQIKKRFGTNYLKKLKFIPNVFGDNSSQFTKLNTLRCFDLFFYVTDGSYFISTAKKNFIFSMYPKKELYEMNLINKVKTINYKFISNSNFTKNKLFRWGINSNTILPYLGEEFIDTKVEILKKEKIILSVGRFFSQLHSKQQENIIKLFTFIKHHYPMFKDFKLILAGGLKDEDKSYFDRLKKIVGNDSSISLKPNIDFDQLLDLYKKSLIFWHFTGLGVDENIHPELVEHLGITPLEAMVCGCIVFCFKAGELKELISDSKTGFLFQTEKELIAKFFKIIDDPILQKKIRSNGSLFVKRNFNYEVFKKNVIKIIFNNP